MCDPVTIGSMALTAAGTMYNNNVQKKAVKATNRANKDASDAAERLRKLEMGRQDKFGETAQARVYENLEDKTKDNQQAKLDTERTRLEDLYTANIPTATVNNSLLTGQQNAGTNFQEAAAKTLADSAAETRQRLNALARMGSYGGQQRSNQYSTVGTNRDIGTTNNYRRGSLSINQANRENILRNPAQVTAGSTLLGDLMIGAGMVGSLAGGAGWDPFSKAPGSTISWATPSAPASGGGGISSPMLMM